MGNRIQWALDQLADGKKVRRPVYHQDVYLVMQPNQDTKFNVISMHLATRQMVTYRCVQSDLMARDWELA